MSLSTSCRSLLYHKELMSLGAVNASNISLKLIRNGISRRSLAEVSYNKVQKDATEGKALEKSTISKAMRAYLQRSVEHDVFMKEKTIEFEIGKRHLANMMGENPETFTQEDINNAIAYLLPSGLYESKARPMIKHPEEMYPKKKAAQFDTTGRPLHSLFYTGKPTFYSLLQEMSIKAQQLDQLSEKMKGKSLKENADFGASKWMSKEQFEETIGENVSDHFFDHFINSMERLMSHQLAYKEKDFFMKFRREITVELKREDIPPLMYTENGIPYMTGTGRRKCATANVTVYGQGSGKFRVNGKDILYFEDIQARTQIMFPLQLTGLLRSVDVEATVEGGGESGQSGAIRYGISVALKSFISEIMVEKMRIAGLLTSDRRRRERQKPGQRGARAKYTWRKR